MTKSLLLDVESVRKLYRWAPPQISSSGEVIRSPDAARQAEVEEQVALRVAALKAAAHTEGHAAGYALGREEGERAGREIWQNEAARLTRLLAHLADPLAEREAEIETALLNLVIEISRALLEHELKSSGETVLSVVRQAIAALPKGAEQVSLLLHPDEQALLLKLPQKLPLTIEADPGVSRGGCRIESRDSCIDFTTEYRFRELVRSLLGRELSAAQRFIDPADDPEMGRT